MRRLLAGALALFAGGFLQGGTLTDWEVARIETELGLTLSASEKAEIGRIAKPDGPLPQWRTEAEARIEQARMADLVVEVVDQNGNPIPGADVQVRLRSNAFHFGGIMSVKDFHDADGNLNISTARYKELFLKLFNTAGLDNGLKPKLRSGNEALLPAFFAWAKANNLPVRGHTLIWPGNENSNHLPTDILADVQAVEQAIASGAPLATIDSLKTALRDNINAMIAEWASLWPVYEWDVINETRGNYRVQELLGNAEMAEWFKIAKANAVVPGCDFFLNENQIISAKSEALGGSYYRDRRDIFMLNIDYVADNGGPITGLGFQSRLKWEHLDPAIVYNRLEEFSKAYGFKMAGTEFEIVENPGAGFVPTEALRAGMTEEMMTVYYSHPHVTGLNAWAYMKADPSAWCTYDGEVKLNGLVWFYLHRIRYHTEASGNPDTSGRFAVRGNKGIYDVIVKVGDTELRSELELQADRFHQVVVTVDDSGGTWGKFPMVSGLYVDTGSWLGWLQVENDPWIWCLDLHDWLYIPESSANAGAGWIYFPQA